MEYNDDTYPTLKEINKKLYNNSIFDPPTVIYSKVNLIFENEKLLAGIGNYRFDVDISPEVKARLMLKWMKDISG